MGIARVQERTCTIVASSVIPAQVGIHRGMFVGWREKRFAGFRLRGNDRI